MNSVQIEDVVHSTVLECLTSGNQLAHFDGLVLNWIDQHESLTLALHCEIEDDLSPDHEGAGRNLQAMKVLFDLACRIWETWGTSELPAQTAFAARVVKLTPRDPAP